MGKDGNRRRLDKIESSLTPKEIVASWLQDLTKFDSLEDYLLWVAEDRSRAPLPKMFQQIEGSITKRPDGRGKDSSDKNSSKELFRKQSELLFLVNLILQANLRAIDFLDREVLRVATVDGQVQAINEGVSFARAIFDLCEGLADTPYPLDPDVAAAVLAALKNKVTRIDDLALAERRRRREERVWLLKALIAKGLSKLELQACRASVCVLLTEVRAIVTSRERLSARYFPGLKIVFKSCTNSLNHLNASATRLVDNYNELSDYIEANQSRTIFATKLDPIKKIDKNAIDRAAEEMADALVSNLVALAQAEMLLSFGESEKAVEILRPIIKGEVGQLQ